MSVSEIENVVRNGLCVGCGVCTIIAPEIQLNTTVHGELVANLNRVSDIHALVKASTVCPFSNLVPNETDIARVFDGAPTNDEIGSYLALYAGYSEEDRRYGSSGGIVTWLLKNLLAKGHVDYVVRVAEAQDDKSRYRFEVISDPNDVARGGTSFYYPVSYDEILSFILSHDGRYAITGVPCFQKALRLLRTADPRFEKRIKYQIGLVCGHLKSKLYLEYLLRISGAQGQLKSACFRRKVEGSPATDYAFEAKILDADGLQKTHVLRNRKIGVSWGMGLFKLKACDFCDDIYAETADIAVMDAWLPKFNNDSLGTSLVIVRNSELSNIIDIARKTTPLHLEPASLEEIIQSQIGGITHRRRGLRFRLLLSSFRWHPRKRVSSSFEKDPIYAALQIARMLLRFMSRFAMKTQISAGPGLELYTRIMTIPVWIHNILAAIRRNYPSLQINPKDGNSLDL